MSNIRSLIAIASVLASIALLNCNAGPEAAPPAPAPIAVLPAAPPVQPAPPPVVAAPPATPLMPLVTESPESTTGSKPQGGGINAPLSGKPIDGKDLLGNYLCALDAKGLPLGPFKLPALGCKIFSAADGTLKIGPTSQGMASIQGVIQTPTEGGFFIIGSYQFPGNALNMKVRMQRKGAAATTYVGNGQGMLNDDKSTKKTYSLTMTKQ